jgi:hypothetical protein
VGGWMTWSWGCHCRLSVQASVTSACVFLAAQAAWSPCPTSPHCLPAGGPSACARGARRGGSRPAAGGQHCQG